MSGALAGVVAACRRHPRAATAAALLAVPVFLLRDALFGGGVLYQRDVHLYWVAEAEAFVRAAAAGAWPSWDPTLGFGQPFLANSSAQVLYPPTWLNLVLRPWSYYTLFVVAHLAFSAAGLYCAARRLGCTRGAGLAGAMAWTASGPFVSLTILWHHFAGAAWLPWVVAAAAGLGRGRPALGILGLGLALGAQQLAGSFDMSTMGAFAAAVVVAARLDWPRPWASAPSRRLVASAAAAMLLGLGLSAGQWMATAEVAAHSGRRALSREVRTYWSLHPLTAADFLLPGFSSAAPLPAQIRREVFEGREPFLASLYVGLAASLLAVSALAGAARRRTAALLGGVAGLALLVALGRHAPFYDLVVAVAPPLKAFRYPVKVTLLVALPWSLLVALGFDAWRRDPAADPRAARAMRLLAAGLAGLGVAAAAALAAWGAGIAARNATVAAGFAVLAAATWARRGEGPRTGPAVAAAALAVADLVFYHRHLNAVSPRALYTHRPEILRHLPDGARVYMYDDSSAPSADAPRRPAPRLARAPEGWAPGPAIALAQQMALVPVAGSRFGVRGSFEVDYTGMFPVHVNQAAYLLRAMEGSPAHRRLLQLGGVTHVVALHEDAFADLRPVAVVPGLFDAPVRLFAVPDPMPRTYVARRTRPGEGMAGLSVLVDPAFDFRGEVLVPPGAPPGPAAARGSSRVVAEDPSHLTLDVDAPDGGYVVVLESYDPGWRATVDGAPAPVVPANVLFRGVPVGPGRHEVRLAYRPPAQAAGLAVSALSVLAAAALAVRAKAAAGGAGAR